MPCDNDVLCLCGYLTPVCTESPLMQGGCPHPPLQMGAEDQGLPDAAAGSGSRSAGPGLSGFRVASGLGDSGFLSRHSALSTLQDLEAGAWRDQVHTDLRVFTEAQSAPPPRHWDRPRRR